MSKIIVERWNFSNEYGRVDCLRCGSTVEFDSYEDKKNFGHYTYYECPVCSYKIEESLVFL